MTSGQQTVLDIFNPTPGDSNGVDQDKYTAEGNAWILKNYPKINFSVYANITAIVEDENAP